MTTIISLLFTAFAALAIARYVRFHQIIQLAIHQLNEVRYTQPSFSNYGSDTLLTLMSASQPYERIIDSTKAVLLAEGFSSGSSKLSAFCYAFQALNVELPDANDPFEPPESWEHPRAGSVEGLYWKLLVALEDFLNESRFTVNNLRPTFTEVCMFWKMFKQSPKIDESVVSLNGYLSILNENMGLNDHLEAFNRFWKYNPRDNDTKQR